MKRENRIVYVSILAVVFTLFLTSFLSSQTISDTDTQVIGSTNTQFYQPNPRGSGIINPSSYWPNYGTEDCRESNDVLMMIPPGGCSPAVVRSDLLEEQNVPVFCKVMMITANPLIDVSKIRSLRFSGDYPDEVQSIGYYPARAAVRSKTSLVGSPVIDNVGYLVVVLKQQDNESMMPESVIANITASIDYDVENALGLGQNTFYLRELTDGEWQATHNDYSFWKGKAFIRAEEIRDDAAKIAIYNDINDRQESIILEKGETSNDIYMPGFYCQAGLNINLEELDVPEDKAKILVDDDILWVRKGDSFLDDRCSVRDLKVFDFGGGEIKIRCSGAGTGTLSLSSGRVIIDGGVKGEDGEYAINDLVKEVGDTKYYLAYAGSNKELIEPTQESQNIVVIVGTLDTKDEFIERNIAGDLYNYAHRVRDDDVLERVKKIAEYTKYVDPNTLALGGYARDIGYRIVFRYWSWGKLTHFQDPLSDFKGFKVLTEKDNEIKSLGLEFVGMNINEDREFDTDKANEAAIQHYYDEAIDNYEEIVLSFPNEKVVNHDSYAGDSYGAVALWKQAELSGKIEQKRTQTEILNNLVDNYPDAEITRRANQDLRNLQDFTTDAASAVFYLHGEPHYIDVLNFVSPSPQDLSAKFVINNQPVTLILDEDYILPEVFLDNEEDKPAYIRLAKIRTDSVEVIYNTKKIAGTEAIFPTDSANLKLDEPARSLGSASINVKVTDIIVNKEAKVKLTPKTRGPRSEANFTFQVGIEKRAIELSPQRTRKMIKDLNKTIEELNETSAKLGEVITAMKAACFTTSTLLTLKNAFLERVEGKARNAVMTSAGGWDQVCAANKSEYGGSISKCFYDKKDDIQKDVDAYKACLEELDSDFDSIRKEHSDVYNKDTLFYKSINSGKETDYFRNEYFDTWMSEEGANEKVKLPGETEETTLGEVIEDKSGSLKREEMRDIKLYACIRKKAQGRTETVLDDIAAAELAKDMAYVNKKLSDVKTSDELQDDAKGLGSNFATFTLNTGKSVLVDMTNSQKTGGSIKEDDKISFYSVPTTATKPKGLKEEEWNKVVGKNVALSFTKTGKVYRLENAMTIEDGGYKEDVTKEMKEYFAENKITSFQETKPELYKNEYKSPEVRFHEFAPYKGLPSLVPFDCGNGWYVATDYDISGFGKPYAESGTPLNFWICNVGKNGLEESRSNDDMCQYVNIETGVSVKILGLSSSDSSKLVDSARNAMMEAARQYDEDLISINDCKRMKKGAPEGLQGGNCEDFMSPGECRVLYNLCDPVICPSDRCNFGGKYRVSNVAQSGIIGSIFLCLPNFPEVWIPICLTGVKAGLDGFISILKSFRDCLQESLDTGKNVGICDEIKSIYLCEFVWRQAGPLMDVAIPNLIEVMSGGITRGGGEYLHARDSWDYMKESLDFFTNSYAVNAINAFKIRNTEEAGTEICKMFVSARYPTGGDFFDNLVKPDVPVQYHAWFEEIPQTTATVPATSHYKVYYHIYAGQDSGVSYQVYLKEPEGSSYYNIPSTYVVDSGYIATGSEADEAKDFTASAGYKKLCVSINGQEECGFGKVSTSAALNYISDEYVKDQVTEDIKTSSDCVSGTPSALSLVNPNLQAGVQEGLNPEIYNRGIIRVCSTHNPGIQVDTEEELEEAEESPSSYTRWKEVGYCDDESIKCWLDTQSVRDAVTAGNEGILNASLDDIENMNLLNTLGNGTMTEQQAQSALSEVGLIIEKDIYDELDKIKTTSSLTISNIDNNEWFKEKFKDLKDISLRAAMNDAKAEALMRIGDLNYYITLYLYGMLDDVKDDKIEKGKGNEEGDEGGAGTDAGGEAETSAEGTYKIEGKDIKFTPKGQTEAVEIDLRVTTTDIYYVGGDAPVSIASINSDGEIIVDLSKLPDSVSEEDKTQLDAYLGYLSENYIIEDNQLVLKSEGSLLV